MFVYVPERLYEFIKDFHEFIEFQNRLADSYKIFSYSDFVEGSKSTVSEDFIETSNRFCEYLLSAARENGYPELPIKLCYQYNIDYSYDNLVNMYHNTMMDNESRFYLLGAITNICYTYNMDMLFTWIEEYINLYNKLNTIDLKKLSFYIHENYIINIIKARINQCNDVIDYHTIDDAINLAKNTIDKVAEISPEYIDHLSYLYYEMIAYIIRASKINPSIPIEPLFTIENIFYKKSFQYNMYNYFIVATYIELLEVYGDRRNLDRFKYIYEHLLKYVNNSMKNYEKYFKGLLKYNKNMVFQSMLHIRRIIKIGMMFHKTDILPYLSREDYNLIMSDDILENCNFEENKMFSKKILFQKMLEETDSICESYNRFIR